MDGSGTTRGKFSRDRARERAIERIAAVIRERMESEGIDTISGFADHVGMSWKPIDKLLNGDPNPPLSTLLQLAHSLDLRSIEELLGPFESARVLDFGRARDPEE
jgi:hypothetical protein